jgi:hypothetical protein
MQEELITSRDATSLTSLPLSILHLQALRGDLGLLGTHMAGPGMFPLARHRLPPERYAALRASPPPSVLQQTPWHFRRSVQVRADLMSAA